MSVNIDSVSNQAEERSPENVVIELTASISTQLQSQNVKDKITAVKTLLAVLSKGQDVSEFFPLVLQEITSDDEVLRHLCFIYLTNYAERNGEDSLMCVNNLQSAFSQSDPVVRCLSLKVLASFKNQDILDIVINSIQERKTDLSPYVRKAAVLACIKVYETQPSARARLIPIIVSFLSDQSTLVVGGALHALSRVAPDRDDLMHPFFRPLSRMLLKLDPWGQCICLQVLEGYCRRNFPNPATEDEDEWNEGNDMTLLLTSAQKLLNSNNPAVVARAASFLFYCGTPQKIPIAAKALIRLVYRDNSIAYIALSIIRSISEENPDAFVPHLRHFYISGEDSESIKILKLRILSSIARRSNIDFILRELTFSLYDRVPISVEAVEAVGRAAVVSQSSFSSINLLLSLLNRELPVAEAAIRMLCILLQNEDDPDSSIKQMLMLFGKITDPETKSSLISLLSKRVETLPKHAHEVLRQIAITFPTQSSIVKLQTISLATKLFLSKQKDTADLVNYVFSLGIIDMDIDVRDKTRLMHSMIASKDTSAGFRQIAKKVLFGESPKIIWLSETPKASQISFNTFSSLRNKNISQDALVVPWADPDKIPPASVRDQTTIDFTDQDTKIKEEKDQFDDFVGFFGDDEKKDDVEELLEHVPGTDLKDTAKKQDDFDFDGFLS